MNIQRKELLVTSFALFSLFFGAGNLLLPPLLGYNAGENWFWVTVGFMITAVVIPIVGILAHARLQGTLYDFGKKVSPTFSLIYCILIYIIAVAIPSPRTAAATHEIAIHPAFGTSPLLTSAIYFSLVLVFVLNRSKILNLIGKFLTPFIVIMLLAVIGIGLSTSTFATGISQFETPIVTGILEGYQTFDAIGAVVVGAVIIVSLNFKNMKVSQFESKRKLIRQSGFIAGAGLFVIYAGLISVGAYYGSEIEVNAELSSDMQRANLLRGISIASLGEFGNTVLSILISLACFTTAIGIVAGTADYFKGLLNDSQVVYIITAIIACILGVVVGQLDFNSIIMVAIPVLLFIYPITIVLILLNVLPEKLATSLVFRAVVIVTFIFSIPDVIGFLSPSEGLKTVTSYIPFASQSLGWVLPALVVFVLTSLLQLNKKN
ncbi:branched-chain amino acid transport system II carrier protein [Winogradskyella echinorum]|uniref:Branched-chain amino acid transport system II carrier protein n=1 Tax=Winogradskyella echinorum TaxID=538189 RepID=A0ABR6XZH6_9FLAO|nr:branched-chain amino acid transport system II carrier protein [Winogradskyella echinorum]MBC3845897.1 branched-chain amino acid transport system II carrier protein [Winogradskyella echinorum]MBC5750245.1 branched-chain amino acid transport system II carrier protein [Winogradskyella echinorum]